MIKVKNKIIPPFFKAVTVWPFIFYKGDMSDIDINHERIHGQQQKEMLLVFFYVLYFIFQIFYGYYKNPFELEAYSNEGNKDYLSKRKFLNWRKYI